MTQISIEELKRLFPGASESTIRRNMSAYQQLAQPPASSTPTPQKPRTKRLRQSSRPLLNKLETEFLNYLRATEPYAVLHVQSKRFKLANGLWYKPDFTTCRGAFEDGLVETAWEVKGEHAFRGGFENLKMAATLYPEITWMLVWKEGQTWQTQKVLP